MSAAAVRSLVRIARPNEAALLAAVAVGDEPAFAELVRRHGPLTLGVCRRVLGPTADADDAFQATFLALAKHAKSIRTPAALPGWLHRTALRAAQKIKARAPKPAAPPEPAVTPDPLADLSWQEVRTVLDAELNAQPDRLRGPLVLCYLDGRTRDDAAAALGVSLSTLKRRIADGLDRLNRRLTRRGVAGVGLAAAALSGHGLTAAVPAALLRKATAAFAALPAAGFVSILAGWKAALAAVMLAGLTAAGVTLLAQPQPPKEEKATAKTDLFGDPLPHGAVLRLGTTAFRVWQLKAVGFRKTGELVGIDCDLALHVWPADGSPKATVIPVTDKPEYTYRVTLSADGRFVAAQQGQKVVVWDVSGAKPVEFLTREFKEVYQIALAPNGEWLAVNEYGRAAKEALQVCHLPTKEWTGYAVRTNGFDSFSFSADGKRLAAAFNSTVVVIDTAEKKELRRVTNPRQRVASAGISPDGKSVVVLGMAWLFGPDPKAQLVAVESGKETTEFAVSAGFSRWVRFAPDGKTVWTGGPRGLCELDPQTGKRLREILGPADHPLAFSADGKRLAACGDSAVMLYDLKRGQVVRPDLVDGGHTNLIMGVTVSPDGKVIATDDTDGEIRLWDAATGKPLGRVRSTRGNDTRVAFLPDSKSLIAVADDHRTPVLYDAATGKDLRRFDVPNAWGKQHTTQELRLTTDGKTLATTDSSTTSAVRESYTVRWNVETGRVIDRTEIPSNHRDIEMLGISYSPDGKWVAKGVTISPTAGGDPITVTRGGFPRRANFSADSRLVTIPSAAIVPKPDDRNSGEVIVYDLAARVTLATLNTGRPMRHAVSADGRLVGVFTTTEVAVWDVAAGKKVWSVPVGHTGTLVARGIAFTTDGRRLITGHDCTALVWDITGRERAKPGTTDAGKLWDALAGADAAAAFAAGWELTDRPADAVPLIREKVQPAKAADEAAVAALVAKLGDRDFAEREAAEKALRQFGAAARPGLQAAAKGNLSAEQAARVERLLAGAGKEVALTGEPLRDVRAVAVLERIGSADARKVLEALAGGLPDARLTTDAKAALGRLK